MERDHNKSKGKEKEKEKEKNKAQSSNAINGGDTQPQVFLSPPHPPLMEESEEIKKRRLISSPSSSSGRKLGGGGALCQAERCTADLSEAKRYHRRHKVCEAHSKAAVVLVSGLRQRFCQQCSRFHELSEFDDSKRSCRRRLAGHNERRRKSSSEQGGATIGADSGGSGEGSGLYRQPDPSPDRRISLNPIQGNPPHLKHFHIS